MLLPLLVASLACSDAVSPDRDILVEASTSATTIGPSEPVTVSVVVTNGGTRTQRIMGDSGFCPAPFIVTAGDGTVTRPGALCAASATAARDLAPGESLTLTSAWTGDARPGFSTESSSRLAPGSYQLRGSIAVIGAGEVFGAPVEVEIAP
jgi:hypothetical protein